MESWRLAWRNGAGPCLSTRQLEALLLALRTNDKCLIQQATTVPPPLQSVIDWPVEAACLLGYACWKGDGLTTVGETEEAFARLCYKIDTALGEPAGCRYVLNPFDEWSREEMIANLLPEVERELARRQEEDCDHAVIVNA